MTHIILRNTLSAADEEARRHLLAARYLMQRARHATGDTREWNRLLGLASKEAAKAERLIDQTIILAEAA